MDTESLSVLSDAKQGYSSDSSQVDVNKDKSVLQEPAESTEKADEVKKDSFGIEDSSELQDEDGNDDEKPHKVVQRRDVEYSLKFYGIKDDFDKVLYVERSDEPIDLYRAAKSSQKVDRPNDKNPHNFEIVKTVYGYNAKIVLPWDADEKSSKSRSGGLDWPDYGDSYGGRRGLGRTEEQNSGVVLEDLRITGEDETRMIIYSPFLIDILRDVVEYYPSQNLVGDDISIYEPYHVLIHHRKELHDTHDKLVAIDPTEITDEDQQKKKHLNQLLEYLDPFAEKMVPVMERRLQQKSPTIDFDSIWYLLRPGTLAYYLYDSEWIGCVINQTRNRLPTERRDAPPKWSVQVWFLDYGKALSRGYTELPLPAVPGENKPQSELIINSFEGERTISSLQIIPAELWDKIDDGARRKSFQERGDRKISILKTGPKQLFYKGDTLEEKKRKFTNRIVLDQDEDMSITAENTLWFWDPKKLIGDEEWLKPTDVSRKASKLNDYLTMSEDTKSDVYQTQCFLMVPSVLCFDLNTKKWFTGHLDRVHESEDEQTHIEPVMDEDDLKIVQSLSQFQNNAQQAWSADFIPRKGEGIIILLHGPPGVGKTFLVECTAISIKRPLLSLTIADIGTKEDMIETQLSSWLFLAERWKAVLLIDEADIFLERRKHTDIARNGIVSAFLRKTEYFNGLLFLTTNRIGHIDEAFMSRVHVILRLPTLSDTTRVKIWDQFFEKLAKEQDGQIQISTAAEAYARESSATLKVDLNGREIRNALQTAIALAEFDTKRSRYYKVGSPVVVEKDHFERVFKMYRTFRNYYDSIKNDTSEKRAQNYYLRNDDYEDS